ncbi:hypothetical protein BDP55DRAFT_634366 [Colletotrichum godetiae]|uniref:DUF7908 domain-containing protein n=1 Tax=Colletotrichum godetiae TaxID=1209918 RepID=A0AAJ0ERT5_9PEZI|nr:uncharacterized protein BDP55DRAFT_634366 [Colletotrichum godetiae]KAK1673132.1 hypothetical protein BDP55DRAFT_634366 [Colletotrichum godetiae]
MRVIRQRRGASGTSTYLELTTITAGPTGLETTTNSTSSADAPLSTETNINLSTNPTFRLSGTPTSSLGTSLSATGLQVPTTTTSSGPSTSTSAQVVQPVILFVAPGPPTNIRRNLQKRMPGGFVNQNTNANRQRCDTATVFFLVAGQLLDGGVPVHYSPGENFKPIIAMGTPPNNAITTTFDVFEGALRFYHPSLPSNPAGFCQDTTGRVHVAFTSRPPD